MEVVHWGKKNKKTIYSLKVKLTITNKMNNTINAYIMRILAIEPPVTVSQTLTAWFEYHTWFR